MTPVKMPETVGNPQSNENEGDMRSDQAPNKRTLGDDLEYALAYRSRRDHTRTEKYVLR